MSTALIPLAATDRELGATRAPARARADFLAQLIAIYGRAPQTRARRRAEPGEATAAYAARSRRPAMTGRALSRSL